MAELSKDACSKLSNDLKAAFNTGKTRDYNFRIKQLEQAKKLLEENEERIKAALKKDLNRSGFEAVGLECIPSIMEIDFIIANLKAWMKPNYTDMPAMAAPAYSEYTYEPFGVCLIMSSFNYPISLAIQPLVGAICAGNCAVLKPSEQSTACEKLVAELIPKYLDGTCYKVACGGVETNTNLLAESWDKIFFTGSTFVGKIVMKAAAERLTPVSLELGGKSPTIIGENPGDLTLAVDRIMWGKCANAGQTCIAPDYVLCHESQYDNFLDLAQKTLVKMYGNDPKASPDYCRIINERHTTRIQGLLEDSPGRIVVGGPKTIDLKEKYVPPTIVAEANMNSKLMKEEIFGPVLPVMKFKTFEEVKRIVNGNGMEKPLSMYIFSNDNSFIDRATSEITSGGVCVNDTLFHFVNTSVPFGGVGPSGLGGYHGKFSYECFSHRRSILRRDNHRVFDVPFRYPPYTETGLKLFKLAAKLPDLPTFTVSGVVKMIFKLALVGGFCALIANKYYKPKSDGTC